MKYVVINAFTDLEDNEHIYSVGDKYPHDARNISEISQERLEQLTTTNNKRQRILIKEIETEEENSETKITKTSNNETVAKNIKNTEKRNKNG